MTIDNLPAQLPRDSSEHFSSVLVPLLKKLIKSKKSVEAIDRATIISKGKLMPAYEKLSASLSRPTQ